MRNTIILAILALIALPAFSQSTGLTLVGPQGEFTLVVSNAQNVKYAITLPLAPPTVANSVIACDPSVNGAPAVCRWVPMPTIPQTVTIPAFKFSMNPVPAQTIMIPEQNIALK